MHINSSLPNLIGGVSQQPELLRLPSHLKAQENGYCSPATGLSKRNPTRHLGTVAGFSGQGLHTSIDYGTRGVVHLEIAPTTGAIRAANEAGGAYPLYDAGGAPLTSAGYLATGNPARDLKIIKEADTTFLLNTAVTVQAAVVAAPASTFQALLWIKAGNYGHTYSITLPGYGTYSYRTPEGGNPGQSKWAGTAFIAQSLLSVLQGGPAGSGGANPGTDGEWTGPGVAVPGVYRQGSVIIFPTGIEGGIASDGAGGSAMAYVHKAVRSITDLPSSNAPDGFTVKVEAGDATAAGDHYLTYDAGNNVYRETRAPLASYTYPAPWSMPMVLTPYSDGFQLREMAWGRRDVGDSETNPDPSFVGKRINDLCFYQDRMGLVAGEGFDLSEQGQYYNFYRTTVMDLLDSDPISGSVSHPKVSTLRHAIPFNKRLLFFSGKAQFELSAGDFLTPKTVTTRQLSEFECSSAVRPVGSGNSLYFPADKGTYSAVYNFFVTGADSLEDATDVSGHVPRYIPPGVTQMASSPVNNLVVGLSPADPTALYVYQYYQDGPQRLQSAWHRWSFGAGTVLLSASVVGTRLILLVRRSTSSGDRVSAEAVDLSMSPDGFRLDRAFTANPTVGAVSGFGFGATTAIALPYEAGSGVFYAVVTTGTPAKPAGTTVRLTTTPTGTSATAPGDLSGCTLEVGQQYRFSATLGQFLLREQAGQGSAGVSRGRTQVARMWVNYADSATFSVEVESPGRDLAVYRNSGRLLGTESARVGERSVSDGRFGCPIMGQNTDVNITLVNDTPFPSSFLSVDWEGYHVSRGRNV